MNKELANAETRVDEFVDLPKALQNFKKAAQESNPFRDTDEETGIRVPDEILSKKVLRNLTKSINGLEVGSINERMLQKAGIHVDSLHAFTQQLLKYGAANPSQYLPDWGLVTHGDGPKELKRKVPEGNEVDDDTLLNRFLSTVATFEHVKYPRHGIDHGETELSGGFLIAPVVPAAEHVAEWTSKTLIGHIYAAIGYGADTLGLGGVTGTATGGGKYIETMFKVIKWSLEKQYDKPEINRALPSLENLTFATGHDTTIAAILDSVEYFDTINESRKDLPIVIQGAGSIGGAVARALVAAEFNRKIFIIDKQIQTSQRVIEQIASENDMDLDTVQKMFVPLTAAQMEENAETQKQLASAGTWVLATTGTSFAKENSSFFKIIDESKSNGIRPAIVDDTWPHVLPNLIEGVDITEVAYFTPNTHLTSNFDRKMGVRVAKPLLEDGTIAYSCEIEPMVVAWLKKQGPKDAIQNQLHELGVDEKHFDVIADFAKFGLTGPAQTNRILAMRDLLSKLGMNGIKPHFNSEVLGPEYGGQIDREG